MEPHRGQGTVIACRWPAYPLRTQTITVRDHAVAVVIASAQYDRLMPRKSRRDFKAFLLAIPSLDDVDLTRLATSARPDGLPALAQPPPEPPGLHRKPFVGRYPKAAHAR